MMFAYCGLRVPRQDFQGCPWLQIAIPRLIQPPSAEDHRQAQKDGQAGPGDAVQGRFGAAGTAEHRAATGSQAAHAITLGAMEQHQNDQ